MKRKLLIALIEEPRVVEVMDAARAAGATGSTLVRGATGDGLQPREGLLGLRLDASRCMLMFAVLAEQAESISQAIAAACGFEESDDAGILFQINIEDSVGLSRQWRALKAGADGGSEENP